MLHAARSRLINQRQMQFPRPSPQKAGTARVEGVGGGGGGGCPLEVKSQVKIRQDKSEKAGEKEKNYVKIWISRGWEEEKVQKQCNRIN